MVQRSLAIWFGLSLLGAACGGDEQVAGGVVIGANIDRTGSIARPAWHEAVKLAVADANAGIESHGGFYGLRFVLAAADSTNTPSVAVARAIDLVHEQGAKMLVTDTSADAIAINQTNYDADPNNDLPVPMVCMACTSAAINNPNATDASSDKQAALRNGQGWQFRSSMTSTLQGVVLMRIATAINGGDANSDGHFKVTVYNIDDAYGNGFFADILAGIDALGIPLPIVEQVTHVRDVPAGYDWAVDALLLVDDHNESTGALDVVPDIVIIVDFPQYAAAITAAYLTAGYSIPLLQTHNFRHDTVVVALGDDVIGQQGTSHAILDSGVHGTNFSAALQAETGAEAGFWDSQSYDAAMTLLLACAQAVKTNGLSDPTQVTGVQIRDAMFTINNQGASAVKVGTGPAEFARALAAIDAGTPIDYLGASGPMDFDQHGNVIGRIAHYRYQSGAFRDIALFDCVADSTCPAL